ncbi:DUF4174 domain-containing protein [Arenibacter sp. GZD96]|uniref:DUF4174 domain-containing protein n=1 Tax=Aurantibrevibacter litoralis TaxID=3106030 RepID=UPI002AFED2B3|nr:DUF4174 domain-containing protein [Arenibacter sp. GZD-96]MEA1785364.1 DUF4174 domain-containing protein [Arenibacter sp. GZD-96]
MSIKGLYILIVFAFIRTLSPIKAQELSQHVWKDRVLIVFSTNVTNPNFLHQISVLQHDIQGMNERKLVVYQCMPKQYKMGLQNKSTWRNGAQWYQRYKKEKSDFEIVLIGLDGGVKLRKTQWVSLETLFTLIDGMPMRQAELRNPK